MNEMMAPPVTDFYAQEQLEKEQNASKLLNNGRFARKMKIARLINLEIAQNIREYLLHDIGIEKIPFKPKKTDKINYDCLVDTETGEYFKDYHELLKCYYDLSADYKVTVARFEDGYRVKTQAIAFQHSNNRCDTQYQYKKEQKIRRVWRNVIAEDRLWENYRPSHMVLTVPHTKGIWRGKEWYAKELLEAFNLMRKDKKFQDYIPGGEYVLEATFSETHGMHIHLHCLVFIPKKHRRNKVHEYVTDLWNRITGGNLYLESLYVHLKDESGAWICETLPEQVVQGDTEVFTYRDEITRRKKFYLDDKYPWYRDLTDEEKSKHFANGIMECIKYHIKPNSFKRINPETGKMEYNIEFLNEVLNNSKGLRMYSKFGFFYGDQRLNFNNTPASKTDDTISTTDENENDDDDYFDDDPVLGLPDEDTSIRNPDDMEDGDPRVTDAEDVDDNNDEDGQDDEDENVNGRIENSFRNLINPFTFLPANPGEYRLQLIATEHIKVTIDRKKNRVWLSQSDDKYYFSIKMDLSSKFIMQQLARNRLDQILEAGEYFRYRTLRQLKFISSDEKS